MKKILLVSLFCLSSLIGCKTFSVNPAIANQNGENDNNIAKVEAKMDKMFEAIKLNAEVKAEVKAVDLSKENNAGRDIVNDSGLMKEIFRYWYLIFVLIIGFMKFNAWQRTRQYEKQIKMLQIEKKDYKEQFLARGIKDGDELMQFRRHHELLKSSGKGE